MDPVSPGQPISLAPLILIVAAIGAGIAAMMGRRLLAIGLGLVALAALAGTVLWTLLP
jgi:hypothetical protein